MIKADIFLASDKAQPVGHIITTSPIAGSRINDFGVEEVQLNLKGVEDPLKWLMSSLFKIPGGVRPQTIWNFSTYETTITDGGYDHLTMRGVIFRPQGMCVACAGTGKFRSTTHKATAKCPGCKGSGYTTVWTEDQGETDSGTTDQLVDESKNAAGTSSS